jgi:hypothetical protein
MEVDGLEFSTSVEKKQLLVMSDKVDPKDITEKLQKWSAASGKSVEFKGKLA